MKIADERKRVLVSVETSSDRHALDESLLSALPREELVLPVGTTISVSGSFLRQVYYLVDGSVDLMVRSARGLRRAARIRRGGFFHLTSYPRGDFQLAEAVTSAPSTAWRMEAAALRKALSKEKEIEERVLRMRKLEKLLVLLKRSSDFSFLDRSSVGEMEGLFEIVEARKGEEIRCKDKVFFLLFGQAELSWEEGPRRHSILLQEDDLWFPGLLPLQTASIVARTYLSGVEIAAGGVARLMDRSRSLRRAMEARAAALEGRASLVKGSIVARKKLRFLAERGLSHVEAPPVIDLSKCIRCRSCEEACRDRHGASRISIAESIKFSFFSFPASCRVCRVPSCITVCQRGALQRTMDGRTVIAADACVGCGACAKACDFGAIKVVPIEGPDGPGEQSAPEGRGPKKRANKCDHCEGYNDMACVRECPTGALSRRMPEELAELFDEED